MSGAQGQGGRPLAVGCECQSATCQREGSHEHLPALQEELQHRDHWRSKRERSVRAKDVQSAVVQLPAHRMRGFLGRRNRPHCSSHRNRGAGHRRAPGSETEVVRQHPHAPGSPLPRQVAACPLQGAVPVAVLSDSPWPRTRFNRSISATSATWARVSAPCGLKSFSACSTTWAEIALPSASATTLNAIHPRWMVLLSSRCTAGPLLLGGWAEHIGPQLMARDASLAFDGQTMMGCHRPTPAHPLPNQGRLNSDSLGECALAADLVYRNSNWAVHARTIALLLLIGNSAARGIR